MKTQNTFNIEDAKETAIEMFEEFLKSDYEDDADDYKAELINSLYPVYDEDILDLAKSMNTIDIDNLQTLFMGEMLEAINNITK